MASSPHEKKAKVTDFKFHDLSHTAATRLADARAEPFLIAEILGPTDLKVTRLTHATDKRKRQALERLAIQR
jgi:integrase